MTTVDNNRNPFDSLRLFLISSFTCLVKEQEKKSNKIQYSFSSCCFFVKYSSVSYVLYFVCLNRKRNNLFYYKKKSRKSEKTLSLSLFHFFLHSIKRDCANIDFFLVETLYTKHSKRWRHSELSKRVFFSFPIVECLSL